MGLLIDMIDVGQGDSFLLTIDGPHQTEAYILIDAGLPEAGQKVLDYVQTYAPTGLDMIIATHLDNDHVGGLATVLTHASLKREATFVFNVPPAIKDHWSTERKTLERYKGIVSFRRIIDAVDTVKTLCAIANKRGLIHADALQGQYWTCGEVQLNVLNPTAERLADAWEESRLDKYIQAGWDANFVSAMEHASAAPSTSAENDSSIVIEILIKDTPKALMCSDAGAAVLKEITNKRQYRFLKVPHHGSDTGLDKELIQQIRPVHAAIPVGENAHGHPCKQVLDLLQSSGARTYCSSKTKGCRQLCTFKGGHVSFPFDKPGHAGWKPIDAKECRNNSAA